jgi:hypothetical protein
MVDRLQQFREAKARQAGDPLGLLHDKEASSAVLGAALARYLEARTDEAWAEYCDAQREHVDQWGEAPQISDGGVP